MKRGFFRLSFQLLLICGLILQSPFALFTRVQARSEPQSADPFSCAAVIEIPQIECEALVALYNGTNGDSWTNHTNWLMTIEPSGWYGLTVSGGHVTTISLLHNQLTGNISLELGNLSNLTSLNLGANQLTGSIPSALGSLSNLQQLYLGANELIGSIPPELGSLSNLQQLYLNSNQLTDSIPPELSGLLNLQSLHLGFNQLTGSIPPALGSLSNLRTLYLGSNHLTGNIPPELGSLVNLQTLYLFSNQLSGSISSALGSLSSLQTLSLFSNQLSGGIPPEVGDLSNLQTLSLSSNQLSGSIPPEVGNLSNLQYLSLSSNHLTGGIPPALGNLVNLSTLGVDNNHLTGDVPVSFLNLINLTNDGGLDIGYNRLITPASTTELAAFLDSKDPDWASTQRLGLISGRVTDTSDNPVANIPITLDGPNTGYSTCTNANGEYTFNSDLNVAWRVRAFPTGNNWCGGSNAYAQQYWPNKLRWDQAEIITLTSANAERSGIDMVLQPGGGISGHVFAADGVTPLSDVCINVSSGPPDWNTVAYWYKTSQNGSFEIMGLPIGERRIRTARNCSGLNQAYLDEWYALGGSTRFENLATPVIITAGQVVNGIDFQLDLGGSISGKVVQQDGTTPIVGARVWLSDQNHQYAGDGFSQADGTYQIAGIPSGLYYVVVSASGYGGVYYPNGYDDSLAQMVAVSAPNNTPSINFQLAPEGTISGHVFQSDGKTPIGGVPVQAWPVRGGINRQTVSAADGSFTIHGLSSGDYVAVADGGSLGFERELYENHLFWFMAKSIPVVQPNDTDGINFTLSLPSVASDSERQALMNLYGQLGGPTWTNASGWGSSANACTWYGIFCLDGHVVYIELSNNHLTGTLPLNWSGLPDLQSISMSNNAIEGPLPLDLGSLTKLRSLELAANQITGSIPAQLSNLSNLAILMLTDNLLQGAIPPELGNLTQLRILDLEQNRLSGLIPTSISNLAGIENENLPYLWRSRLKLDYNHLTVPVPYPSVPPTALEDFLALKNPQWYLNQSAEAVIPVGGGTLTSQDDQTTIIFPPNIVSTPTAFEIVPQPAPQNDTGAMQFANQSFEINALDANGDPLAEYTFSQPVTITLDYTDSDVAGLDEATLRLYYWDDLTSDWKDAAASCSPVSTYTRELDQNRLSVNICHLSEFALLGINTAVVNKTYLPGVRR